MINLTNYLKSKIALFILVSSFSSYNYLSAQVYSTGIINLSTSAGLAMTAKIDVSTQVNLTLTGPAGRWFALGFNANSMIAGTDVVIVNSAGTITNFDANLVGFSAPVSDAQQNWTITSDLVSSGVRTITATRALNTGDVNDFVFSASNSTISLIWARAGSATFNLGYHGSGNRGISSGTLVVSAPTPPNAPTGSGSQTFCLGSTVSQLNANGSNIQWYSSALGGSPLNQATLLLNGTTYFASQTVNGIESINRLLVTTIVNTVPQAPSTINGALNFCAGSGQTYAIQPVSGAESYIWSTPQGVTGISNSTSIPLTFDISFTNGQLFVSATNSCGQSISSSINISQHENYTNSITVSSCGSYNFNGTTYTQTGNYLYQGNSVWGCDSIINLNLTINNNLTQNLSEESCGSYNWNGQVYTQSGLYSDVFTTISGCDSIVNLDLTIFNNVTQNISEESCGSYNWNGQVYSQSGLYSDVFTTISGCDSIVNLDLTINPIESITIDTTVINSFVWNNQTYSSSGIYSQFFTNEFGCDSAVNMNLTILNNNLEEPTNKISIYPNPVAVNQILHIKGIKEETYELYDFKGTLIRTDEIKNNEILIDFLPGVNFITVGEIRFRLVILNNE